MLMLHKINPQVIPISMDNHFIGKLNKKTIWFSVLPLLLLHNAIKVCTYGAGKKRILQW